MTQEDQRDVMVDVMVAALSAVAVEVVRVAFNCLDRYLAHQQDRKAEEQRRITIQTHDDSEFRGERDVI